ncbi:MAG: dihydroorotase [Deltaproteobacteria bacterium]|nr:MAG: dihydroorotase [Deltaproteobacteria bacterium]
MLRESDLILIKGPRVVDPLLGIDRELDVLLDGARIREIGKGLWRAGARVVEARGKMLFPGLVDLHAHLRDLGESHKETIFTGSRAAALGGFTTVVNMPNTLPPLDSPEVLLKWKEKVRKDAAVRVFTMVCISKGRRGEQLSPLEEMSRDPLVVGATDDGNPVRSEGLMRRALEISQRTGILIADHPEDGPGQKPLGSRDFWSEPLYVERDLMLLRETGGRLHLQHISMEESLKLIRQAKEKGLGVTCETTPHHLILFDGQGLGPNAKVNPPLRNRRDVEALREALKEGIIDAIATDHAPHSPEEKARGWEEAPFGISGIEVALPLVYAELVTRDLLRLEEMVKLMSQSPARIMGIDPPRIQEGARADFVIFDPEIQWVLKPQSLFSKGKNTPFSGKCLTGKVWATFVEGRAIVLEGYLTS